MAKDSPCGSNQNGTDPASVWDRVIAANIPRNSSQSGIPVVFRVWAAGEDTAFCNGKLRLRTPSGRVARAAPGVRCPLSSCSYSGYIVAALTPLQFLAAVLYGLHLLLQLAVRCLCLLDVPDPSF